MKKEIEPYYDAVDDIESLTLEARSAKSDRLLSYMVTNRAKFLIKEHNYHFQYKTFLANPFFPELSMDVIRNF